MKTPYIEITQPIGTFYISKLNADIVGKVTEITPRSEHPEAVQRDLSPKRVNEIKDYCSDPDATFPTPIIISIYKKADIQINNGYFEFDENSKIGQIIDGQHRIEGILKSNKSTEFELPIVFMFNLIEEEKAYVFSIINSKQTRVSMSLIYDLFELSKHRSPQKTCHEIARAMNMESNSPFYNRLKMLGKKEDNQELASLSQGTFVKYLLNLISKKPDEDLRILKINGKLKRIPSLSLRDYFIEEQDHIIQKIVYNNFKALSIVFPKEWNDPKNYILSKTTGFGAVIKSFNFLYTIGNKRNDLSIDFFRGCYENFKNYLEIEGKELTSKYFPSNAQQQSKLAELIINSNKNSAQQKI